MHKFEHKELLERIKEIDTPPVDQQEFRKWLEAESHKNFLLDNEKESEFALYFSSKFSFFYSVLIPRARVAPPYVTDILRWSGNCFETRCSYTSSWKNGSLTIFLEKSPQDMGPETLKHTQQIIYGREDEGRISGQKTYYEILQEFAHATGIHWSPDRSAYCKINKIGDIEEIVSISNANDDGISLISFSREELDKYMAAGNYAVIRFFELYLYDPLDINYPSNSKENLHSAGPGCFYNQWGLPTRNSIRGFQIVEPKRGYDETKRLIFNNPPKKYVSFVAFDFRNKLIKEMSTDPRSTTNYFDAENNNLPFELSPCFFSPEVMSKYKNDRDKYVIDSRKITCRGSWTLKGIDTNEAGQIHAYIVDLRNLPFEEQVYWKSFNEKPKAQISNRAIQNDFEGKFSTEIDPVHSLKSILKKWNEREVCWWKLTDVEQFNRVSEPFSASKDEWADSFLELAKLVIEGFRTKAIQKRLDEKGIKYNKNDGSIKLLETLCSGLKSDSEHLFSGLKTIQEIRSKVKSHSGSSRSEILSKRAISEHGTFRKHFCNICLQTYKSLEVIEELF